MRSPSQPFSQDELDYIERETARSLAAQENMPPELRLSERMCRAATILQMVTRKSAWITAELYDETGNPEYLQINQNINSKLEECARIKPKRG